MTRAKLRVLSGCQMEGLVSALQIIFPHSDVEGFHTYRLLGADRAAIQERMGDADLLFTMPLGPTFGEFSSEMIEGVCPNVQFVPQVVFPAFHPDIIYIEKVDEKQVQSPLTDYNSTIAASAFLLSLSVEETLRLYNAYVYNTMGYFNLMESSERDLLADFADHGISLNAALRGWNEGRSPFMYSMNHPKSFVLADVALEASRAAGLEVPASFPCPDLMPDRLAEWVIYPVYPELAKRVGKQGHYYFKALSFDRMNILDLNGFVERSFRLYEQEDASGWVISKRLESSKAKLAALLGKTMSFA